MTVPVEFPPQPYIPWVPGQNPFQALYNSICQVSRLAETLEPEGHLSLSWAPLSDILDTRLQIPGQMWLRLDVGFIRPGVDRPMPVVAGRPPDRMATAFFDLAYDPETGFPLIVAGDRLTMIAGSVFGTWQINTIPDVAQDYLGAHHVEVQVVEVAQNIVPGASPQPFPGAGSP